MRIFVSTFVALFAVTAMADHPPNILFIAVDDLRPQLACYGKSHVVSPNIDRLASQGVLFERAYCMVPTCGASRASLMTGLRPTPKRFTSYLTIAQKDAPNATTMNTFFKQNGYETISLGKVFHNAMDNEVGWSKKPWRPEKTYSYGSPENRKIHSNGAKKKTKPNRGPAYESFDASEDQYADGMIANEGIKQLRRLAKADAPFFLAVGFKKPHLPFVCPKKYWDLYDASNFQLPETYHVPKDAPKESIHASGELRSYFGIPNKGPVSDETARNLIHGYHACVSFTDALIGSVLDELDSLELRDNTIVVLWGDHGWNLGEHTLWCKHSCYETSMQIPLIVAVPGIGSGRSKSLIETIDIYPTLCELTGLTPPDHLVGASFVPNLKAPNTLGKNAAIGRFQNGDTIRTNDYRFTEYTNKRGQRSATMMYDHKSDPAEDTNISLQEEQKEAVASLTELLHAGKGKE